MLWRKQQKEIINWINEGNEAMLVSGARQTGKTYLIENTLKQEKCDFVKINLLERPDIVNMFNLVYGKSVDVFLERITALVDHNFVRGKTIIFFDEVQECKDLVTKIKFLVEEGSYRYILSGSLLGVELTGLKSAPVGSLKTMEMFPLDFYEFLKAVNIKDSTIVLLKNEFDNKMPVDGFIHEQIIDAFRTYLIVGGMPKAVDEYLNTRDYKKVVDVHKDIITQYKVDFTKYEKESRLKLIKTYDLIPNELADKNKRYNFANIDKGVRFNRYESSFDWLKAAGVAIPVFNITEPRLPLAINAKSNLFKLFMSDVGLLTTLYGRATQVAILGNDDSLNAGAIYENYVAQELRCHGFDGYYFNSHKQGELDFVIDYMDSVMPIEVKSGKDYTRHNALNNVINNKDYGVKQALVLSNANISQDSKIVYYPIYMTMFIDKELMPIPQLKNIDLSNI